MNTERAHNALKKFNYGSRELINAVEFLLFDTGLNVATAIERFDILWNDLVVKAKPKPPKRHSVCNVTYNILSGGRRLSTREIAEITGFRIGTVSTQLSLDTRFVSFNRKWRIKDD